MPFLPMMIQEATEDVQTVRGEYQLTVGGESDPADTGREEQPERPENGQFACPLCACSTNDRNEIYVHLVTSHRKGRISKCLLSALHDDLERTN